MLSASHSFIPVHSVMLFILQLGGRSSHLAPLSVPSKTVLHTQLLAKFCLQCFDAVGLRGRKGIWPVKTEWCGAGVVICLERGADLHMVQPMPLPLTVSCFSKIQIGFTFLVPADPGSPGQRVVKRVCE